MNETAQLLLNRYDAADNNLETKRGRWDDYEKLFNNELQDSISALTKSEIFDPVLSTMQIERSNRVMAQLMTGKFKNMSKDDEASTKLMNMTVERYVLPNANSQFDFLTKCRMVDLYSNIYGTFPVFIDWTAKEKGYVGPDMWLLNKRDVFKQVGAVSLEDSDYVIVRTWKSIEWFESVEKLDGYKDVKKVIRLFSDKAGEKEDRQFKDKSSREYQEYTDAVAAKKSGFFKVLSMYERDRWVDYVPGADTIIRDMDNPNDDDQLPVIEKYSLPLLDDADGMGDSERGKSMQMALNSNWNLYAGGIKMSMFPPVKLAKNKIAAMNSIKWGPAEKWLGKMDTNFAEVLNLTPQGTNTFNNTRQSIYGSLQQQFGTSFTNVSATDSQLQGKTPQALKMQAQREGARDSADRFYMESFLTKVLGRFANLITKKQPKALQIRLFKDEIDELFEEYPDFKEMYNKKTGKIKIGKTQFKNALFDYEIITGSTYLVDKKEQQDNLTSTLALLTQNLGPNEMGEISSPIIDRLKQEGRDTSVSELVTRILSNSGTPGWNKILPDLTKGDSAKFKNDQMLDQQAQQFQQVIQQMMQPSMNQVPTEQGPPQGGMPPQGPPQPQQGLPQPQQVPGGLPNA